MHFPSTNTLFDDSVPEIIYISDLHLDKHAEYLHVKACRKEKPFSDFGKVPVWEFPVSPYFRSAENIFFSQILSVMGKNQNSILCMAGDFYNSPRRTLRFVQRLNDAGIRGFFVLGNHDYFTRGNHTIDEVISYFDEGTKDFQNFRFLRSGLHYVVDGVTFIGDTGWSSFVSKTNDTLESFDCLSIPDLDEIKNFNISDIRDRHDAWVSFAEGAIQGGQKTVVLTHFPMIQVREPYREDDDLSYLWWGSDTRLAGDDYRDVAFIYGHTHNSGTKYHNHTSAQCERIPLSGWSAHSVNGAMGYLIPTPRSNLSDTNLATIASLDVANSLFFDSNISSYLSKGLVDLKSGIDDKNVKFYGFRRMASNKSVIRHVLKDVDAYVSACRTSLDEAISNFTSFYSCVGGRSELDGSMFSFSRNVDAPSALSVQTISEIRDAIRVVEERDMRDIRKYMLSLIISGYVYNKKIYLLPEMRPLNDYDVFRMWLVLLTANKYAVDVADEEGVAFDPTFSIFAFDDYVRIGGSKHTTIVFKGVEIKAPSIDGVELTGDELLVHLSTVGVIASGGYLSKRKTAKKFRIEIVDDRKLLP